MNGAHRLFALPMAAVAVGYLLLLSAWLVTNPPGAAPDEQAQYVRAAGLSQGQVLGRPASLPRAPGETLLQWHFQEANAKSFELPSRLAPPNLAGCYAFRPATSAACINELPTEPAGRYTSYVALYPPTLYAVPALLMTFAPNTMAALLLGRIGIIIVAGALLGMMFLLSWTGAGRSLVGPLLATTPMVVFLCTNLTDSALEIAGAGCLAAALLALRREGAVVSRATAFGLGLGGFFLAATRPTGPAWLLFVLVIFTSLIGIRPALALLKAGGLKLLAAAAAIVLGCAFTVVWSLAVKAQGVVQVQRLGHALAVTVPQIGSYAQQMVGVFGWLDTFLPVWAYALWGGILLLAIGWALVLGTGRERACLLGTVAGFVLVSVALAAVLYSSSGFSSQGRYFLPGFIAIPLIVGAVIGDRGGRHRRISGAFTALSGLVIAVVQLLSWVENSRRYAVGRAGPLSFFLHGAQWSPPGGWMAWGAVAVAGCIFLGVGTLLVAARTVTSEAEPLGVL